MKYIYIFILSVLCFSCTTEKSIKETAALKMQDEAMDLLLMDGERARPTAIDLLEKAIDLAPHKAELYYNQASLLIDNEDYTKAIARLNEAIKIEPKEYLYFKTRALAYQLSGDGTNAQQDFAKAKELEDKYNQ